MLNKQDLDLIEQRLTKRLASKDDLSILEKSLSGQLKSSEKHISGQLKSIKEDITDIRKKMNSIISFFDREYLALRDRIEKIEKHLGLQSPH